MRKNIDYNLLIETEKVRYQSDFSAAHWLNLIISQYERGIDAPKIREAYEKVMRCAKNVGVKAAVELARGYPRFLGFPDYFELDNTRWEETQKIILADFGRHEENRFRYLREGD